MILNFVDLAIREAGGAFGKMEVAREEEYFYKKVILLIFIFHIEQCIYFWLFFFLFVIETATRTAKKIEN